MSDVFKKLLLFSPLLLAGCLISGLYGILHDQLTYTLSPDYFHRFKFITFGIPPSLHNYAGAAIVGWQATWWMGVFIGIPVLSITLVMPGWRAYVKHSLIAFVVVAITALLVGLSGLAYAYSTIDANHLPPFDMPPDVDQVAFTRVGMMHNFGYLGGFLGIIISAIYLVVVRLWIWRKSHVSTASITNGS